MSVCQESMSTAFSTEFIPGWGDVDQDRVLHFPIVFRYFKETEARFYRSLGIPRGTLLQELDIWMPRVETHCLFVRPIKYDEALEVRMTVGDIADKTITYSYQIVSRDRQSLLAEGYLSVLIVSGAEFKPVQVPESLRELLNPYVQ